MTLRLKLICLLVALTLALGGTLYFFTLPTINTILHQDLNDKADVIAGSLGREVVEPILVDDQVRLQLLLDSFMAADPDMRYAYIVDAHGDVLVHTFGDGFPTDLLTSNPLHPGENLAHQRLRTEQGLLLDVAVGLMDGAAGTLHIGLAEKRMLSILDRVRQSVLGVTLLFTVIALAVALLFSRMITEPLQRLTAASAAVGRREFGYRLPVRGRDEISRTAAAFNQMAASLEVASQQRDEAETLLQAIFDNAAVGITLADGHGTMVKVNPAFAKMVGYSPAELEGKGFREVTYSADVGRHQEYFDRLIRGEKDHLHLQKRYQHRDGRAIWGQLTLSLINDQATNSPLVIGMVEDISTRKRLEEEQQKSHKLESLGILAGGIAHDFNNLLTAILGNIGLARRRIAGDAAVVHILEAAEQASVRAKGLTEQLLTFSRGGAPIKKLVSLDALVAETSRFYLRGSKVRAEFDLADDLPAIAADAGQISQVLQNLLENSIQAMPDGGTVHIGMEKVQGDGVPGLSAMPHLRLTVRDEGEGIAADIVDKIFDPYFTTREQGNGLGLAICYSIIKNHQGRIVVDSEPGQGTIFTVYLPIIQDEGPVALPEEPVAPLETGLLSGTVLLMDDEAVVREVGCAMLTSLGLTVAVADDGAAAVALYQEARQQGRPFGLVIVDLTVPGGMGGRETMEQLRAIDPQVKVLVSSGFSHDPIMADYRRYGFAGVIPKPYTMEELRAVLQKVMAAG